MSEWKEATLGEIVTFQRGHDLPQTEFKGGKYPIVGSNGIIGYHNEYTTEENGITIGRSGNIGNPFFINSKFWAHNTTLYVKEFHNSFPKFVYYFLKTLNFQKLNSGSAVPSLNRNYIHPFPIKVPDYEEQKQIADVLSCLDRKIDNLRRQNETLEKIAQTLFKHWFIDFEFPNDDGKPYKSSGGAMVASELGDIPEGWRVITLKECLQHLIDNRGKTPKFFASGIPALSAKFIKGGNLVNRENFNYISIDLFAASEKLQSGDIIMTSEAPLGELYYISKNTNYYPAQRVFALRANQKVVLSAYLNYWLGNSLGQSLINRRATGSTVQGIKQTELYQCEVLIPQRELMEKFSHCFNKVLYKKEFNENQIQTLTKTRDTLLPKLMSGEIRVKEAESIIEEGK
ncbi:restriction endonuclease subunit S [Floridanema evergladense]|uniref:Restriction endonuclease subunit S n=1 Tax=Floridaenema evergladense BLCC-F167 TaxID=3153639 RepID=A0ABV4WEZ3_9CYAN